MPGFDSIGGLWGAGTGASVSWPARNREGEEDAGDAGSAGSGVSSGGGSGGGRRRKKKRRSTRSRYESLNNGQDELGATHMPARNTLAEDRDASIRRHRRFNSLDSGSTHAV